MPVKQRQDAETQSTSDFRMTFAGPDFCWFGEPREDMPIIRWPDGTLCQPLIFFFGYMCRLNLEQVSSMEPRAYQLREWFYFLRTLGIQWFEADDFVMHRWRHLLLESGLQEAQVEKKLRSVYHFYLHIPDAMQWMEDGSPTPDFVGRNKRGNNRWFPISTKQVRTWTGERLTVWSGSKAVKEATPDFTVPDNDQCDRVLAELRSPSKKPTSTNKFYIDSVVKRERDWGMGRLMVGAGLRADEVPEFKLADLTKALLSEGILSGLGSERLERMETVADLAGDRDAQEIVLRGLKYFAQGRQRLYIGVKVKGKGQKVRKAAFLIDLVTDILTVIVWGSRARLVREWQARDPDYFPEDTLFLSYKTSDALTGGAVSDIMLRAFKDANVPGSGHDLRKNYATNLAVKILDRNLDKFGYFTHAVLNTVLHEVATALGHKNVNTTTRHFTNLAVIHSTGLEKSRKRGTIMRLWDQLLKLKDLIGEEQIRLCGTAMKLFVELPKDSPMYQLLEWSMKNLEYNPDGLIDLSPPKPILTLVSDNT